LAISLLEDSGYMARVAYIMDEIMTSIGLQGESFVPLILGLGCNVPGVAATRTMKEKESKLNTILLIPLMSCSARLPVYALFVEAFFEEHKAVVLLSLYLLSMLLAIIMGKVFSRVFFKGQVSPLVIELPPYRVPTLRNALVNMWERGKEFLQRAGTIIFGAMILMWLLANLPAGVEYGAQDSLIGRLGSAIAPFLKPLGFGKWQAAVALLFGIFAKEIVVGTLGVLYGVGEAGLAASIAAEWTPLSAYSFMVMVLIYFPCVATIAAIRRETNSWGWTTFAAVYPILLGWGVSFIVFNVGRLLGFA